MAYEKNAYNRRYAATHKVAIRARQKKWVAANIERLRIENRARYWKNKERYNENKKTHRKRDREKNRIARKIRRHTDINYRLNQSLRSRIRMAILNNKGVKWGKTEKLLGCSVRDFKLYIESRFEPGMSWANYGIHGWHIDHIMPLAIFDLSRPEHQQRAFHFSNHRPLWASDNWAKNAKLVTNQFALL
jgi:hypothetical protein